MTLIRSGFPTLFSTLVLWVDDNPVASYCGIFWDKYVEFLSQYD